MHTCPLCPGLLGELDRCVRCGAAARVETFEVHALISQRPHSRLYRGVDAKGRNVAIKELMFTLVPDAATLEAFERETTFLRRLEHPQIPRFIASAKVGDGVHTRLYLVQQLVEGRSLAERFRTERLSERELVLLAAQVLTVLDYLHACHPRVVHRDVKPANLVAPKVGPVRLVDFGTARGLSGLETHRSTLVGTLGYMPPEQLGGTVDVTSDLFSLGATLVHGLTGHPPPGPGEGAPVLPRDVKLSGARRRFLARLMHPKRAQRFQSAAEARRALLRPARRWPALAAAAVALLIVVALVRPFAARTLTLVLPASWATSDTDRMKFEALRDLKMLWAAEHYYYQEHDHHSADIRNVGWDPVAWCADGARLSIPPATSPSDAVGCHFRYHLEVTGQGGDDVFTATAVGAAPPALGLKYTVTTAGSVRGIPQQLLTEN